VPVDVISYGKFQGGPEMPTTSRRDVILSAAVAASAFCLDKSLAIVAPADSQQTPAPPVRSQRKPPAPVRKAKTPDPKPSFLQYKIGDTECTAVYDGIWEKTHDPAFFSNATTAETKRALTDAGLTSAFVPIPITVFVVKLNGKLVLCDAGGGNQVQAFNPEVCFRFRKDDSQHEVGRHRSQKDRDGPDFTFPS
jgi:hypothetical protein